MPGEPESRDDDLDAREAARARRRDRDAAAAARDLMRPGMGKVFKQIRDAQAKAGTNARKDAGKVEGQKPQERRRHV